MRGNATRRITGHEHEVALREIIAQAIILDVELGRGLECLSRVRFPNPRGQLLHRHVADAPWASLEREAIESLLDHVHRILRDFAVRIGRAPMSVVVALLHAGWYPGVFSTLANDPRLGRGAVHGTRREAVRGVLDDARERLRSGLRELVRNHVAEAARPLGND